MKKESSADHVAWVANDLTTGGIGTVCRYAAEGVARLPGYRATVVSLKPSPSDRTDPATGVRYVALGLQEQHGPRAFLRWLTENPQQFVITNDVAQIESSFPYFSRETIHIVGIHDSSRRHIDVAVRNHRWVNGVAPVARHIQNLLEPRLNAVTFHGLMETVPNGAIFPPSSRRMPPAGPIRLLFMGSVDPFKGIFDLVPILEGLRKASVPVRLTFVGGRNPLLESRLKRRRLDSLVTFTGWIPHDDCYRMAENSDIFLMLSRKEAFGMVTIEAMAMGAVPLAYDFESGNREIIEHERNGLLLPLGDFAAYVDAIKSLHENSEELARLSDGAMNRARSQFNVEAMASNLSAFLSKVHVHCKTSPSERKRGLPPETAVAPRAPRSSYQLLPRALRNWFRNRIGASPHLCHWLLNRW